MKRSLLSILVVSAGLLIASASILAHHSVSGEFDNGQPIEFTGTVTMVHWTNPHIYTQVEAKDKDGKVHLWRVEGSAPNSLYRQGWRKDTLKPGTVVSFKGIRGIAPDSINVHGDMTLPDGTKVWMGQAPAAH